MAKLNIVLFSEGHGISKATDKGIFRHGINPVADADYIEIMVFNGLWDAGDRRYKSGETGFLRPIDGEAGDDFILELYPSLHINLYVDSRYTIGVIMALVAALNACRENGIKLTLYHYNKENGEYFPQEVL